MIMVLIILFLCFYVSLGNAICLVLRDLHIYGHDDAYRRLRVIAFCIWPMIVPTHNTMIRLAEKLLGLILKPQTADEQELIRHWLK
jgi:hypothetical protein